MSAIKSQISKPFIVENNWELTKAMEVAAKGDSKAVFGCFKRLENMVPGGRPVEGVPDFPIPFHAVTRHAQLISMNTHVVATVCSCIQPTQFAWNLKDQEDTARFMGQIP